MEFLLVLLRTGYSKLPCIYLLLLVELDIWQLSVITSVPKGEATVPWPPLDPKIEKL